MALRNEGSIYSDLEGSVCVKYPIGESNYRKLLSLINDSVTLWKKNRFSNYVEVVDTTEYIVDSLICLNSAGDRFLGCFLERVLIKPNPTAGLTYLLGEKIDGRWYFFTGAHCFIPHEMNKNGYNEILSYQLLHEIALKEIYAGYLKWNGKINEDLFTSLFEGPGWVNWDDTPQKIRSYTRKDYEQFHLRKVRSNWYGFKKDSITP